ncbi:TetR/AcrR family transcriptional regulator [Nocardia speluncae]|uniref:TetR/AcrR family transcriptional regulator n=1 Tax=Nocardia speluncae TaxID=419477 RepID=A0A846X893_9NOCA|nr:TetR/AcrR family transcriptional regulator [Nocardia speluncae]NKY32441.1 TetR/AcrR family transcriptional regulator [Nocardia speluncae]
MHPPPAARPLRADAERTVRAILDAAERVLGQNPNATLEQIAEAAGVARTTVHRRFASREDLIRVMAIEAWRRMDAAVDAARPHTAPPLVALHQATANVIAIKHGAAYALDRVGPAEGEVAEIRAAVFGKCDAAFRRARAEGVLPAEANLEWVRRVYLALITETVHGDTGPETSADPDTLARRVIDTLLHGVAGPSREH